MKLVLVSIICLFFNSNVFSNFPQVYSDTLDTRIKMLIDSKIRPIIFDRVNKPDLKMVEKTTIEKYGKAGEEVVWVLQALYFYFEGNIDYWFNLKVKINRRYPDATSIFDLNNDAWFLFQNSSRRKHLKEALKWSAKVLQYEPSANYYDTYANLLYKLGKKEKAIILEEKAISIEPNNKDLRGNLIKMQSGLPTWPAVQGLKKKQIKK